LAKRFKIEINRAWCKGCGLCVGICPKKTLELDRSMKSDAVRESDCIGCRQCENICPDFAITIGESAEDAEG
jgi:2-oxoglutarate ferredoxin oxidoreductase subunit delta